MRKSAHEKRIEAKRAMKGGADVSITMDELMLLLLDGGPKEKRAANPTQRAFIYDPERIMGYMGPAGCAKTSTLCARAWLRALMTPGSKGLVARANYNDLMDTTGLRMTEMLNRLPKGVLLDRDKSPPMKWYIEPIPTMSPEGDVLCDDASTFTFMGLQDGLGSYEFDHAAVDEMAECDEARIHEINTRLRNQPKSWPDGCEAFSIGGAFNPPDKHHWLYAATTGKNYKEQVVAKPWMKLYVPQSRENIRNLPQGYYENLARSLPEDMRVRLIEGFWGSTFDGKPVFPQFKYELHALHGIYEKYDPYTTLYRFWDFGYRHPVCIWAQIDTEGRLLTMREEQGENIDIDAFAPRIKMLTERWFPGARDIRDYGDPAARQKKDTGSTLTTLSKHRITLRWKISGIDEGLRTIRLWLERMINGEPAIQIDRQHCPILCDAFRGGYHYPKELGGTADAKPEKDGFFDHSADAFRYGVINVFGSGVDFNDLSSLPASVEYDATQDSSAHWSNPYEQMLAPPNLKGRINNE